MRGAPALSLPLAAAGPQSVLLVVLVILAALVVLAIVGTLVLLLRRRVAEEPPGAVDSPATPVPPVPIPSPSDPPQPPLPLPPDDVSSAPAPATPPPDPPSEGPPPAADATPPTEGEAGEASAVAASPTQTPDDVDRRSPAELAAAAQAADAADGGTAGAVNGDGPGSGAVQHEMAIGPPRPLPSPPAAPDPARLRMLGLTLGMLTERMRREHPPQLGNALARLVDSDQEAARGQLSTLALSLLGEDEEPSMGDGQLSLFLEEALEGEVQRGFSFSSMPEFQQALSAIAPDLRQKLQTIVWARNADSIAILTTEDVETLERVAVAMATALMLDNSYDVRRLPGEGPQGRS